MRRPRGGNSQDAPSFAPILGSNWGYVDQLATVGIVTTQGDLVDHEEVDQYMVRTTRVGQKYVMTRSPSIEP